MFESIKQYIPTTKARQERLFAMGLQKQLGSHEALLQVEWPDGSETFQPADWHKETSSWLTPGGARWYKKGRGGESHNLLGVPVVHVSAENAGVVSAQSAKIAAREENLEYCDADGRPLEVVETDATGEPAKVEYADSGEPYQVAADGGEIDLYYDLSVVGGEVINRSEAGLYDPFPVSRQEADQAVEFAKTAANDLERSAAIKYIAVGFGLAMLMLGFMWLLGQIGGGGGDGGVSVGLMVNAFGWW